MSRLIVVAHARIGDGVEQLIEPLFERSAALRRVEIHRGTFPLPQNVDERPRLGEACGEGASAFVAHEIVGIRAFGEEGEAEGMSFAQNGQHAVDGARGGRLACPVAVEADGRLGREQPELIHLPLGEGGAERRHGIDEARLIERDHIHIAFDHDQLALSKAGPRARAKLNTVEPLSKSLVSGEFRYFGSVAASRARAPKAMMRPLASMIGMVSRCGSDRRARGRRRA